MINRILGSLLDPRFFYRPDVFVSAVIRKVQLRPARVVVKTSWGDTFDLNPNKLIGSHIYMRGVHELSVCEALVRLIDKDETVADVGANIGVMTSLMSLGVGERGKVFACEAHPAVTVELRKNVSLWKRDNIKVIHAAISNVSGMLGIMDAADSQVNEGTSRVIALDNGAREEGALIVPSMTLDELVGGGSLGVLKVDVEGHAEEVFLGGVKMFHERRVRDVIFESNGRFPSAAHQLLMSHGYTIFRIEKSLFGPRLVDPECDVSEKELYADFVATENPVRLHERFSPRGWKSLGL